MSEIEQLKARINESLDEGILTDRIRDDYDPSGDMMIKQLVDSGEYATRKAPMHRWDQKWRIFKAEYAPY